MRHFHPVCPACEAGILVMGKFTETTRTRIVTDTAGNLRVEYTTTRQYTGRCLKCNTQQTVTRERTRIRQETIGFHGIVRGHKIT